MGTIDQALYDGNTSQKTEINVVVVVVVVVVGGGGGGGVIQERYISHNIFFYALVALVTRWRQLRTEILWISRSQSRYQYG
jgi:hypothetical protein